MGRELYTHSVPYRSHTQHGARGGVVFPLPLFNRTRISYPMVGKTIVGGACFLCVISDLLAWVLFEEPDVVQSTGAGPERWLRGRMESEWDRERQGRKRTARAMAGIPRRMQRREVRRSKGGERKDFLALPCHTDRTPITIQTPPHTHRKNSLGTHTRSAGKCFHVLPACGTFADHNSPLQLPVRLHFCESPLQTHF